MPQRRLVADLHLHSRYSMATSPRLNLEALASAALQKGIDLLAAPDFTHPSWRSEMQASLEPVTDGIYKFRCNREPAEAQQPRPLERQLSSSRVGAGIAPLFILVTEISCIWQHAGKSRRVHVLLMAPSFETADRISDSLSRVQNMESDGRPMIRMSAEDLYQLALEIDERCVLFPAHAWTPWYGVYGSKSGFDSLEECFGSVTDRVPAVETGLSTNPQMNWAVEDIGQRAIVSFSDAHSAGTIGRELTVFDADPDYDSVRSALFENRVVETIEFHPEHGKYHINGHRKCGVSLTPDETPSDGRCPVCRRPLTLGVLHRISELANHGLPAATLEDGLMKGSGPSQRPFRQLVPLRELIAQGLRAGVNTKKVVAQYDQLVNALGSELTALTSATYDELAQVASEKIAELILAVRVGEVDVRPGYDGVYGVVSARI